MTYMQPAPPPSKVKRFGFVALGVAAIVGLFVGGAAAGLAGVSTAAVPAPAPTVTVTATAEAPAPAETTAPEPAPEPAVYKPAKSEWAVSVKVRDKQCYGSAGCNVTVKTVPSYQGTRDLPTTGTIEVFYELSGDESGPILGSFTVIDQQVHYTEEESLSTKSSGTKVKVKITEATYSEN